MVTSTVFCNSELQNPKEKKFCLKWSGLPGMLCIPAGVIMQSLKVSPGLVLQEVVGTGKRDLFLTKTRENCREAPSLLCLCVAPWNVSPEMFWEC